MTPENKNADDYRFYIFMRNDLDSMNTGKACAQAAHAQRHADFCILEDKQFENHSNDYKNWCFQTSQSFGSTVCLQVDGRKLEEVTDFFKSSTDFPCGKIHDPTYPLIDGSVLHLIPLDTCGWVFGHKDSLSAVLRYFELHP